VGIQRAWTLCGLGEKDEVRSEVPEGQLAQESLDRVRSMVVQEHLLAPVARASIDDFLKHAHAIDAIGGSKVAQLHVRALEEIATFLEYVLLEPKRYPEFRWRWDNFKGLMIIRNALRKNDLLAPELQAWLDANGDKLQWFKLKNALPQDKKIWSKLHHWLYPIRIDEIFAAVDKTGAYEYEAYALNSHFVHLSPVADYLIGFEARRSSLRDVIGHVGGHLLALLQALLPIVTDVSVVRHEMLRPVLRYLYRAVARGAEVIREASHDDERVGQLFGELTRDDFDCTRLAMVALGAPPRDPLLIQSE
jgi:hypothetical protein